MAYRIEHTFEITDPFTILGGETAIEEHLRLDIPASGAERDHLLLLAEAAIRHTIDLTGRSPVAGTTYVHTNHVPARMELPFRAASLDAVEYFKDGETTYTTIATSNFGIHGNTSPSLLFSRDAFTDPSDIELDHPLPIRFTFTTLADDEVDTVAEGETPEARQVSRVFVLCALLFLSHLYENRQAVTYTSSKALEVPLAFKHLVASIARIR